MNASRFDSIVRNRAHERATKRIEEFRKDIGAALAKLHPSFRATYYNGTLPRDIKGGLALVVADVASGMYFQPGEASRDNPLKPCEWLRVLWTDEQALVEKELLATMDEMQKALCAPEPSDDSPQPAKESEVAT